MHSVSSGVRNFNKAFTVEMDASACAVGAILMQENENGKSHPIQVGRRTMNQVEGNYQVSEKEASAVISSVKNFTHFHLSMMCSKVNADHQVLCFAS